jgi:hypothetical protein
VLERLESRENSVALEIHEQAAAACDERIPAVPWSSSIYFASVMPLPARWRGSKVQVRRSTGKTTARDGGGGRGEGVVADGVRWSGSTKFMRIQCMCNSMPREISGPKIIVKSSSTISTAFLRRSGFTR